MVRSCKRGCDKIKVEAVGGSVNGKEKVLKRKLNKRQWPFHNLLLNCDGKAAIFHVVEMCTNVSLFLCLLRFRKFLSFFFCCFFLLCSWCMCWIVDVPVFQKAEHYNESSSSVSHQNYSLDRKKEMPESSLHVVRDATILRILEGFGGGAGFVQERRSLARVEKSFMSLYVCLLRLFI